MRSRCDSPSTVADGEGARTAALERYLSCRPRRTTAHSGNSPTRGRARSNDLEPLAFVELCVARASRSARRRHGPLPAEVMRNHGSPLATITSRSARPAFRTFTSMPGATRLRPLIGAIRLSHRHRIGSRQRRPPQLVCHRARTQLSSACGLTASTPWESLRCGCPHASRTTFVRRVVPPDDEHPATEEEFLQLLTRAFDLRCLSSDVRMTRPLVLTDDGAIHRDLEAKQGRGSRLNIDDE